MKGWNSVLKMNNNSPVLLLLLLVLLLSACGSVPNLVRLTILGSRFNLSVMVLTTVLFSKT